MSSMPPPPSESAGRVVFPVAVLRRNGYLLGFTFGVAVVGLLLYLTAGHARSLDLFGLLGAIWGTLITPIVLVRNSFPLERATTAEADEAGLAVHGLPFIERERIRQAYVQPGGTGAVLRISIQQQGTLALVCTLETATHLLRALRLDATEKTATVKARSPISPWLAWPLGFAVVVATTIFCANFMPSAAGGFLCTASLVAWAILLVLGAWSREVTVGADGVEVSWLGRARFFAYAEMLPPVVERQSVRLTMRDGRAVKLAARNRYDHEARQGADDQAISARIERAYHAETRGPDDPSGLLRRGARSALDWLRALKAVESGRRQGGYRVAALTDDQLSGIVANPGADPTLRAGAAIALAHDPDPRLRAHIARAAEACAHPRLRVALDVLATSDRESDWVEALEGVVDDDHPRRGASRNG
jgi:hypothetical protein